MRFPRKRLCWILCTVSSSALCFPQMQGRGSARVNTCFYVFEDGEHAGLDQEQGMCSRLKEKSQVRDFG